MPVSIKLNFSADLVFLDISIMPNYLTTIITIVTVVYRIYHYFTQKCPVCPLYARTYKTLFQRGPYLQFAHYMPGPIYLYFSVDLFVLEYPIILFLLTSCGGGAVVKRDRHNMRSYT